MIKELMETIHMKFQRRSSQLYKDNLIKSLIELNFCKSQGFKMKREKLNALYRKFEQMLMLELLRCQIIRWAKFQV